MQVQFFRSKKMVIKIKASGLNHRLLFHFALGCVGDIDPLTGMIVNLVNVDYCLEQIDQELTGVEFEDWSNFLQKILGRAFAESHFASLNVVTIQLSEVRHWGLRKEGSCIIFWQTQIGEEIDGLFEVTSTFSGLPSEYELQQLIGQQQLERIPIEKKKLDLLSRIALISPIE